MSHELLLICGADRDRDRHRRAALVGHAAAAMPGSQAHRVIETAHATVALVESAPAGGDFAELREGPEAARVHIATSSAGLAVAEKGPADGADAGSEGGHVRVAVTPDGAVDLSTDGMAFLPCFWAEHDGVLHASTHLASLVSLGVPADPDTEGLLQYLVMFHPLQQRTILLRARLLPPGGHLRWTPQSGPSLTERPLFVPSSEAMTDGQALAAFAELWPRLVGEVFERNAGSRTVLALSGGLDSRAIATAGADLGIGHLSYTYGGQRNRETAVASQIARRLELTHLTIPITDERRLVRAEAIAERLDGAHGPGEMYESWFADVLRSFADVVVNGLAGGPLWGDDAALGLSDPAAALSRTIDRYGGEPAAVARFLRGHDAGDVAEVLRSGLAESMSSWDFGGRSDTAVYWRIANRQLRWGNMLVSGLRREGLRLEAPFLDGRFLRFAAALSAGQRLNGRLYLRVHREILTRTADIPRSDDGNSPARLNHVYWSGQASHVSQLAALARDHPVAGIRRGWRQASRMGTARLHGRGGPSGPADRLATAASVFPAEVWVRDRGGGYAQRLADLLDRARGTSALLSDEHLDRAAEGIRRGRPTASAATLGKVATVGLWSADFSVRSAALQRLAVLPVGSPGR